ncbi:MAG: hypothetical protein JSU81_03095 [Candidatus Coatesbacteria bacterium]|nr:MAG: hypothetical protein JSU81_03095 [Candidatus Coatesbacteria bacterium]
MGNPLATLGYLCLGTLFGLAVMALTFAVARRRASTDEALSRAYGPLHALLSENASARAKVKELEEKLMAAYASESAPYSPEEKKAAAEGFLAAEVRMTRQIIAPNRERIRAVVAEWGHLLRDDDYLALTAEAARWATEGLLTEVDLPKVLREERPLADPEGDLLEQMRESYLELSYQRRAGFFPSLAQGVKSLFAAG